MIISYVKFFIIFSPKLCNLLIFSFLAILVVIYLYLTAKALNNILLRLKDRSNVSYRRINNLYLNYSYELPLDYKIYTLSITIFKIFCYIFLCIIIFIILRYFRLGLEVNLSLYWSKLITLPYIVICIIGTIYLLFFYLILSFWSLIYYKFYKELKKLYIYLYQFGGVLDPSSYFYVVTNNSSKYHEPNINRLFLAYLRRFAFRDFSWFLHKLTVKPVFKGIEPFSFTLANQQVPLIFIPLYYFLNYSTYTKTVYVLYIKYLLEQLRFLLKPIVKLFPYVIIIVELLYEILFAGGILKNIFYILLFVFIYNMFINLAIFYDSQVSPYNRIICFYYYERDLKIYKKIDNKTIGIIEGILMNENIEDIQNMLTYMDQGLNGGYIITDLEKWFKLKIKHFSNTSFVRRLNKIYKTIVNYLNKIG